MRKSLFSKRGELPSISLLTAGVLGLLVLAIIVVVVQIILGQMATNTSLAPANSYAANAISSSQSAIGTIPTWFTILITVIVAVAIVLVVLVLKQLQGRGGD
jgi:hypothetical protein